MKPSRGFEVSAILPLPYGRGLTHILIKDKYQVDYVLDDRNQVVEMWRSLGLTCLQVADGDF